MSQTYMFLINFGKKNDSKSTKKKRPTLFFLRGRPTLIVTLLGTNCFGSGSTLNKGTHIYR